jgi:hypothetical protein
MLKEKSRKIPAGSRLHKQRRRKGGNTLLTLKKKKNSKLFNKVVSLRRVVVETSTVGRREISK